MKTIVPTTTRISEIMTHLHRFLLSSFFLDFFSISSSEQDVFSYADFSFSTL